MVLCSDSKMKNLLGFIQPEIPEEDAEAILESIKFESSDYLTLCEQLRFIYDVVLQVPDPEIVADLESKIVVAFWMAKKMNSRLAHYQRSTGDPTGSKGNNLLRLGNFRKRGKQRKARL